MFLLRQLQLNENFFLKLEKSNLALRCHVVLLFQISRETCGYEA